MRYYLTILILLLARFYAYAQGYEWTNTIPGTNPQKVNAIATDQAGNVYATGVFYSVVDFDPGTGVSSLDAGVGGDVFVVKYDVNGVFQWAFGFGQNVIDDEGTGIEIGSDGSIYLTGFFSGSVDFDPGAGTTTLITDNFSIDLFVAKYDQDGNYIWAFNVGGPNEDATTSLTLDDFGHVYVAGRYNSTVDFDPSVGSALLVSAGATDDMFVAKYDINGNYKWAIGAGSGSADDLSKAIDTDLDGNVYVTGEFRFTADFDPSGGVANLTYAGTDDVFVAKYDSLGVYVWAYAIGNSNSDKVFGLSIDSLSNIYLTGTFLGTIDIDLLGGVSNLTSAGSDMYITKFDSDANYIWANSIGSSSQAIIGYGLTIDDSNNVFVGGNFTGTIDFDPSAGVYTETGLGSFDVFLAKYDELGNFVWAGALGNGGLDEGFAITTDINYHVLLGGSFSATVDFNPSANTDNYTSLGLGDGFVTKWNQCTEPDIPTITSSVNNICSGASVGLSITLGNLNNATDWEWYTSSCGTNSIGTGVNITVTPTQDTDYYVRGEGGCIVASTCANISLTILPAYNLSVSASICDGSNFTFPDGSVSALATVQTSNLNSVYGCDSMIVTTLTVNNIYNISTTAILCDGGIYTFPDGNTSSVDATNTSSLICITGCDSVIITSLTVMPIYSSSATAVICDNETYTFPDGSTGSTSGIQSSTLQSIAGCDSVIATDLTVNATYLEQVSASICEGETYTFPDGSLGVSSEIQASTYVAVNGCDSIIETDLTVLILPIVNIGSDTLVCGDSLQLDGGVGMNSYSWSNGDTVQFTMVYVDGTYNVNVVGSNGCQNTDQIIVDFDACNSIVEHTSNAMIIYPNPTQGVVYINDENDYIVSIYNTIGKLIIEGHITAREPFDLNLVPAGLYILKATDVNQNFFIYKILKY